MKLQGKLVLASLVLSLPYLLVLGAGWWWLYERGFLLQWVGIAIALALIGNVLIRWLAHRRGLPSANGLLPSPHWAPADEPAWQKVVAFAERVKHEKRSFNDLDAVRMLLVEVLKTVAREYHPDSSNPVLETPVTHLAKIVELVARDLGTIAAERVPGSHILTLNEWIGFKDSAATYWPALRRAYQLYRVHRFATNPPLAILREIQGAATQLGCNHVAVKFSEHLTDTVIFSAGARAIELYSGRLAVGDSPATSSEPTPEPKPVSLADEPLRVMLIGQVDAGKSSLVNALFGELKAVVDVLPTSPDVAAYELNVDDFAKAQIIETAGYEGTSSVTTWLGATGEQLRYCDILLVVCKATEPARHSDRQAIMEVVNHFQKDLERRPPVVLVVLTHIDDLRPPREWNPPYDLNDDSSQKACSIRGVALQVAEELQVATEKVIPVCLCEGRLYNIDEVLWPALIDALPEARRALAVRISTTDRNNRRSYREVLQQAINGGRYLGGKALGALRPK